MGRMYKKEKENVELTYDIFRGNGAMIETYSKNENGDTTHDRDFYSDHKYIYDDRGNLIVSVNVRFDNTTTNVDYYKYDDKNRRIYHQNNNRYEEFWRYDDNGNVIAHEYRNLVKFARYFSNLSVPVVFKKYKSYYVVVFNSSRIGRGENFFKEIYDSRFNLIASYDNADNWLYGVFKYDKYNNVIYTENMNGNYEVNRWNKFGYRIYHKHVHRYKNRALCDEEIVRYDKDGKFLSYNCSESEIDPLEDYSDYFKFIANKFKGIECYDIVYKEIERDEPTIVRRDGTT